MKLFFSEIDENQISTLIWISQNLTPTFPVVLRDFNFCKLVFPNFSKKYGDRTLGI